MKIKEIKEQAKTDSSVLYVLLVSDKVVINLSSALAYT